MKKDDVLRANLINFNLGINKFTWCKEFYHSSKINTDLALAGIGEEIMLIDREGRIVEKVEKN